MRHVRGDRVGRIAGAGDNIVKILISGYADNKMVAGARKIDVDAVLEKPFTLESLFYILKEKIEDRKVSN